MKLPSAKLIALILCAGGAFHAHADQEVPINPTQPYAGSAEGYYDLGLAGGRRQAVSSPSTSVAPESQASGTLLNQLKAHVANPDLSLSDLRALQAHLKSVIDARVKQGEPKRGKTAVQASAPAGAPATSAATDGKDAAGDSKSPASDAANDAQAIRAIAAQNAGDCIAQAIKEKKLTATETGLTLFCDGNAAQKLQAATAEKGDGEGADQAQKGDHKHAKASKATFCWDGSKGDPTDTKGCSLHLALGTRSSNFSIEKHMMNGNLRFREPALDFASFCLEEAAQSKRVTIDGDSVVLTCKGEVAQEFFKYLDNKKRATSEFIQTQGQFLNAYVSGQAGPQNSVCGQQLRLPDGRFTNEVSCRMILNFGGIQTR